MSVNKMATQIVLSIHKSLCDEINGKLGDHVVDEWEKCGHIWDTAHGESIIFGGSGD
jgi:hypothetical protein